MKRTYYPYPKCSADNFWKAIGLSRTAQRFQSLEQSIMSSNLMISRLIGCGSDLVIMATLVTAQFIGLR